MVSRVVRWVVLLFAAFVTLTVLVFYVQHPDAIFELDFAALRRLVFCIATLTAWVVVLPAEIRELRRRRRDATLRRQ
jgi:hypothetical protein